MADKNNIHILEQQFLKTVPTTVISVKVLSICNLVPAYCVYQSQQQRLLSALSINDDHSVSSSSLHDRTNVLKRHLQSTSAVKISIEFLFVDSTSAQQTSQLINSNPTAWATSLLTNISNQNPTLFGTWNVAAVAVDASSNTGISITGTSTQYLFSESSVIIIVAGVCVITFTIAVTTIIIFYMKHIVKRTAKVTPQNTDTSPTNGDDANNNDTQIPTTTTTVVTSRIAWA